LVRWTKTFLKDLGASHVGMDWHGHRDRGLGLINTLTAISEGCERVHGCALGIGERAGNTEMDLLLVNLKLLGWIDRDLTKLGDYVHLASKAVGRPVRREYPVFGQDAFETGTGVHAAAGVPAGEFGLEQKISVGPMSGKSNVIWFLENRNMKPTEERIAAVLKKAKSSDRLLTEEEVLETARAIL
jgi:2-isopropylmalate synthase